LGNGVVLVSCRDQRGIVAAVTTALADRGGNIVDLEQHTDADDGAFFLRVEFEEPEPGSNRESWHAVIDPAARRFDMSWSLRFTDEVPRTAILVSREAHCLHDLLGRAHLGELAVEVVAVISDHPDHARMASWYGVPYHHLPITGVERAAHEHEVASVLERARVELVVLARYMRILSPEFVARWQERMINIHHSFLPAFIGARPYHQAHERGVKVIGVTAHYVTADLDEGPIIDQDVVRVSHRDDVDDLRRKGRDLEVAVLARAVEAHVQHRILIYRGRTIVFS
jgi:formyltetrahydrofolate deformylase